MGVQHRVDSIQNIRKRKTLDELTAENEQLIKDKDDLISQVTDLQLALCDVYELLETAIV